MCVVLGVSRPPGSIYCLQCVRMGVEKAGGGKEIGIGGIYINLVIFTMNIIIDSCHKLSISEEQFAPIKIISNRTDDVRTLESVEGALRQKKWNSCN